MGGTMAVCEHKKRVHFVRKPFEGTKERRDVSLVNLERF